MCACVVGMYASVHMGVWGCEGWDGKWVMVQLCVKHHGHHIDPLGCCLSSQSCYTHTHRHTDILKLVTICRHTSSTRPGDKCVFLWSVKSENLNNLSSFSLSRPKVNGLLNTSSVTYHCHCLK